MWFWHAAVICSIEIQLTKKKICIVNNDDPSGRIKKRLRSLSDIATFQKNLHWKTIHLLVYNFYLFALYMSNMWNHTIWRRVSQLPLPEGYQRCWIDWTKSKAGLVFFELKLWIHESRIAVRPIHIDAVRVKGNLFQFERKTFNIHCYLNQTILLTIYWKSFIQSECFYVAAISNGIRCSCFKQGQPIYLIKSTADLLFVAFKLRYYTVRSITTSIDSYRNHRPDDRFN